MRYTKEIQDNVKSDIKKGLSASECSKKYELPVSVILKWNKINTSDQRAKEIALRKYQEIVSLAETKVTEKISENLKESISDDDYLDMCDKISRLLYTMASEIIKKERDLNQKTDIYDGEVIMEITERWGENNFIKSYKI